MGFKTADRGSQETPVIFPAIPWLVDGNRYEAYLESCLAHLKAQECPVEVMPPFLTTPTEEPFTRKTQMNVVTPKLNEIVDAFLETDATHVWFLNADNEVPPDALCKLLELNVDVASGISPRHRSRDWTTAFRWVPPPSPEFLFSTPYFKCHRMEEVQGKIMGGKEMVGTGHFCLLVKRRVFDFFRFRWNPPRQKFGSELTFWMDAQMLGYSARIDGRVLTGHLPEYPLADLVKDEV